MGLSLFPTLVVNDVTFQIAGAGPAKTTEKSGREKDQQVSGKKQKDGLGNKIKNLFRKSND